MRAGREHFGDCRSASPSRISPGAPAYFSDALVPLHAFNGSLDAFNGSLAGTCMASFSSAGIADALDFETGTGRAQIQLNDGRVVQHPAVRETAAAGLNHVGIRCW